MLIERVLADLDVADPDERGGNPLRGSRLGRCARQSAYMLWADLFPPEPLPARAKLVFRFGDLVHDLIRREFRRVIQGEWGMEEAKFWFKVPLAPAEAKAALAKIADGRLRGTLRREGARDLPLDHGGGVILDESEPCLYVPVHPDGITDLPGYGLATVEIKSMATGSFKRAVGGWVDYSYRVQMAVEVDAAGLDTHLFVSVRKDTCHLLEVLYTKRADRTEVRFTKASRAVELLRLAGGEVAPDGDWEAAEVRHPFESGLLEDARERVRKVLMAEVGALPTQEYGPVFLCPTCEGTGTQSKAKSTGEPLKKGPKPCADCSGGVLDEATLPWQCSYCPWVSTCWKGLYRLEITDRPRYIVPRSAFAASGIVVEPPEPEAAVPQEVNA